MTTVDTSRECKVYAKLVTDLASALRDAVKLFKNREKDLQKIRDKYPRDMIKLKRANAREELRRRADHLLRLVIIEGPRS